MLYKKSVEVWFMDLMLTIYVKIFELLVGFGRA